jgi:alpha-mannosidase
MVQKSSFTGRSLIMAKPTLHLICNAHLDPVWQWRWEEGCAETLSTFSCAVDILREHPDLIFNHNESVLYQWVLQHDPKLFKEIQKLVRKGKWVISGGWFLQPDVNLPGIESIIRHITVGRQFFKKHFNVTPIVAYNFDSFGHSGGLPQVLCQAGYKMYIHMRPQEPDLHIPSDLYQWKGVDGSTILTYRIAVGLYHTERDNIVQRLNEGTKLALKLNRDVPVFWGIGNHGGGATCEDLKLIDEFIKNEKRVHIIHSTTERLYTSLKKYASAAPIIEGDIQRVFTGCYTSISRLKRKAVKSLGELTQAESIVSATWWKKNKKFPAEQFSEIWEDHLFNDFHDILPGSCTELAEQDALDVYGRASESYRRLRLQAVNVWNIGKNKKFYIPVTVFNTNLSCTSIPIETECMLDLRPKWTGNWHLRVYDMHGNEIPSQKEQPESVLPFNGWRRKVSFFSELPSFGIERYEIRIHEGEKKEENIQPKLQHILDAGSGLVTSIDAGNARECLSGGLLRALVVEDNGDAWGADRWNYRNVVGVFEHEKDKFSILAKGPVRSIKESKFTFNKSTIVIKTIAYQNWNVLEFHLRIQWNEQQKRLKLSIPTVFNSPSVLCEVPGGAIHRPADGEEHVHSRWCMISGSLNGKKTSLGIINNGQHGLDFQNGELRLSVLRSAVYCHEQGFKIAETPSRKFMDQGVHEVRLLITAGDTNDVLKSLSGFADWLAAPPLVYSHLPIGSTVETPSFISIDDPSIRLLSCNQSYDRKALIVRLQETTGLRVRTAAVIDQKKTSLTFEPFQIQTLRINRTGDIKNISFIDEK